RARASPTCVATSNRCGTTSSRPSPPTIRHRPRPPPAPTSDEMLFRVPPQDAQRAQRVPAAGFTDGFGEGGEGEAVGVAGVEEPGAVGLAAVVDEANGIGDALVGGHAGASQVVEAAEDV